MAEELFSGWAPEAQIGDSLLRRFLFSMADRGRFMADRLGCPYYRTHSVSAVDPGSAVIFDNYAVLLQPPTMFDLPVAVGRVCAFFPPDRPFVLMSPWSLGDLSVHGLALMGHPPFMFRPVGETIVGPNDLRIVEVTTGEEIELFERTLVEAYPMPGGATTVFDERLLGGPIRFFVGFDGTRAVATAGAVVGHGVNDVEWVAVMDGCRGKGYGESITYAATRADPSLPAVLMASDLGFGVYRRLGFESLLRLTLWYRGAAPS